MALLGPRTAQASRQTLLRQVRHGRVREVVLALSCSCMRVVRLNPTPHIFVCGEYVYDMCLKCVYAVQSLRTARAQWRRRLAVARRAATVREAERREPESAQTDLPSSIKYDIYTRPHFVVRVGRSSRKAALTHHGSAPRPPAPPLSIDHATMDLLRLRPAVLCTPSRGEAGDGTFHLSFLGTFPIRYVSYCILMYPYM